MESKLSSFLVELDSTAAKMTLCLVAWNSSLNCILISQKANHVRVSGKMRASIHRTRVELKKICEKREMDEVKRIFRLKTNRKRSNNSIFLCEAKCSEET